MTAKSKMPELKKASATAVFKPSWRMVNFAVCLLLFALCTWVAFTQAPRPDPFAPVNYDSLDGWRYPIERNAHKRLPFASADLNHICIVPDSGQLWAVGRSETLLHSSDGGRTWQARSIGLLEKKKPGPAETPLMPPSPPGSIKLNSLLPGPVSAFAAEPVKEKFPKPTPRKRIENTPLLKRQQTIPPKPSAPPYTGNLTAVQFVDNNNGWVTADFGTLLVTTNGGGNWSRTTIPATRRVNAMFVDPSSRRAWIAVHNGELWTGRLPGGRWAPVVSQYRGNLSAIFFAADGRSGWALDNNGRLLRTTNGGRVWQAAADGPDDRLAVFAFSKAGRRGWAISATGRVYRTVDGSQWTAVATMGGRDLRGMAMAADGLSGWAVGRFGAIWQTADGGLNWQRATGGPAAWLSDCHLSRDGRTVWTAGGGGAISISRDAGRTWHPVASGTDQHLAAIAFADDDRRGWAVGRAGTIVRTIDGGRSWQRQDSGTDQWIAAVAAHPDGQKAWAVTLAGAVIATDDGGRTWRAQIKRSGHSYSALFMLADGQHGWVAGKSGRILRTANGGEKWAVSKAGTRHLLGLYFLADGMKGWAVGQGGLLWTTNDGGNRWRQVDTGVSAWLRAVFFMPDQQHGWVAGDNGTLLSTIDGGKNWRLAEYAGIGRINAVTLASGSKIGMAVADGGVVLVSADNGATWRDASAPYARYPALWYYLSWMVIAVLLVPAFRRPPATVHHSESVADMLSSDRPLEEGEPDPLQFGPIALGLSRFLRNENTQPPLTVAVNGAWGTGKSSLMNLLRADLKRHGFRPVWFNAWHHQREDSILAALLENIHRQATPPVWHPEGWLFRFRLAVIRGPKTWALILAGLLVATLLSGYFIKNAPASFSDAGTKLSLLVKGSGLYRVSDANLSAIDSKIARPRVVDALQALKGQPFETFDLALAAVGQVLVGEQRNEIKRELDEKHTQGHLRVKVTDDAVTLLITAVQMPDRNDALAAFKGRTFPSHQAFWTAVGTAAVGARHSELAGLLKEKGNREKVLIFILSLGPMMVALRKWFSAFGVNPADLLASMSGRFSTKNAAAQLGFRHRYAASFNAVARALRPRTMVLMIDDLDRCLPQNTLAVLEAINYLVSSGPCFFIIGMDMERVERCVGLGFKEVAAEVMAGRPASSNGAVLGADTPPIEDDPASDAAQQRRWAFAHQYLEKLINIEVPIPAPTDRQSTALLIPDATMFRPVSAWRHLQATAAMFARTVAPVLVALAVVVAGFSWGIHLGKKAKATGSGAPAATVPATGAAAAGPALTPGAAAGPTTGPDAGADTAGDRAAFFTAGHRASPSMTFFYWPLILLVAAGVLIVIKRPDVVVRDSPEFVRALAAWHPVIIGVHNTPRSIKRFMNRLRYFAMRLRPGEPEAGAASGGRPWFGRGAEDDKRPKSGPDDELDESGLVALAALQHCHEDLLAESALFSKTPGQLTAADLPGVSSQWAELIIATIGQLPDHGAWPPSPAQREQFLKMTTLVKVR